MSRKGAWRVRGFCLLEGVEVVGLLLRLLMPQPVKDK